MPCSATRLMGRVSCLAGEYPYNAACWERRSAQSRVPSEHPATRHVCAALALAAYPSALPPLPFPAPQLLVVSPLTRALQTAQLAFLPSYRQAPVAWRAFGRFCSSNFHHLADLGQHVPVATGTVWRLMFHLYDCLLPCSGPVVVEPLARERVWHASDIGNSKEQLRQTFPDGRCARCTGEE